MAASLLALAKSIYYKCFFSFKKCKIKFGNRSDLIQQATVI